MPFPEFRLVSYENVRIVSLQDKFQVHQDLNQILSMSSTELLASHLKDSLLQAIDADEIDKETSYAKANPGSTQEVKDALKVSSWGSGGGLGIFGGKLYRFKNQAVTTSFGSLFDAVKQEIPGAEYSRNNFFHGHSVFDKVDGSVDFRIVFHAYEYPGNIEATKSRLAKEVEPAVEEFTDGKKEFYQRNAIWSMRNNTIYIPNYYPYVIEGEDRSNFPYGRVLKDYGCAVEQKLIGEEIIAFNVFPSERVKLFLKQ